MYDGTHPVFISIMFHCSATTSSVFSINSIQRSLATDHQSLQVDRGRKVGVILTDSFDEVGIAAGCCVDVKRSVWNLLSCILNTDSVMCHFFRCVRHCIRSVRKFLNSRLDHFTAVILCNVFTVYSTFSV